MKIRYNGSGIWECTDYANYILIMKSTKKGASWQVIHKEKKIGSGNKSHVIEASEAAKACTEEHAKKLHKLSKKMKSKKLRENLKSAQG